jgi:hypothetical protein
MSEETPQMIRLWGFTVPADANYGQFYMTVKDKTVCVRFERKPDAEIGVAVWGEQPPPIFLDDLLTDSATEEP